MQLSFFPFETPFFLMLNCVHVAILEVHLVIYSIVISKARTVMDSAIDFCLIQVHKSSSKAVVPMCK